MENQVKEKKPFSIKEFFKSTSFKCIAVLLVIVLVCGILLTICNSLFAISPEEELNRVLGKIYPDGKVEEIIYNEDHATDKTTTFDNGEIEAAYKMDDGNYLISSAGNGGYGGAVTCWVVIEMADNKIDGIGTVAISKAPGETFLSRITADDLKYFSENYTDGEEFVATDYSDNTAGTGATAPYTRNGITNSVNTALEFVRSQILGEVTEPDPFEAFSNTKYIDTKNTTVALAEDGTSINYKVVTTGYGISGAFTINITVNAQGVITAYTIPADNYGTVGGYESHMAAAIKDGTLFVNKNAEQILTLFGEPSGEDGEFVKNDITDETIVSGASESGTTANAGYSNFLCVYAALFAASNYDNAYVMALENSVEYTDYIDLDKTICSVEGDNINYTVVTTGYGISGAFTINITVNAQGVITAYNIPADNYGTVGGYESHMAAAIKDGTLFVNKNAEQILTLFGEPSGEDGEFVKNDITDETIVSGASESGTTANAGYSNFLCVYAALFAASNYDTYSKIASIEQQKLNEQMSEIYGEEITVEAVDISKFTAELEKGTVNSVYKIVGTDNYIVSATGKEGFASGSVTAWIVVKTENGKVTQIGKMVIESNVGQSYIDRLDQNDYDYFNNVAVNGDFTVEGWQNDQLHGGATVKYTMTAIVNSVNTAKNFVSTNLLNGGAQE